MKEDTKIFLIGCITPIFLVFIIIMCLVFWLSDSSSAYWNGEELRARQFLNDSINLCNRNNMTFSSVYNYENRYHMSCNVYLCNERMGDKIQRYEIIKYNGEMGLVPYNGEDHCTEYT